MKIPILSMVDDALLVSECGYKTSMLNSFINTKTSMKKLQYGTAKCFKMHVGKKCIEEVCPELYIDGWKLKEVEEVDTDSFAVEDEYEGLVNMETVQHEKYLGDILTNDGKNTRNIAARKNRGIGVVNQILTILEEICFGKYYFQVAMVLRNSLLISSLLTNSEAWYNLSSKDVTELERVDEDLLRKVLECPISTPREMLYLELGVSPIRNIIRSRRLIFLQYILQEEKNSLIYKFLKAQMDNSVTNDWCLTVAQDMEVFKLGVQVEEIETMSEAKFKALVKEKEKEATLEYLNSEKISKNHTKVMHIMHSELAMQDYLKPNTSTIEESKFTFLARSRMLDVRNNFKGQYTHTDTLCPLGCLDEDTQQHLLVCDELNETHSVVSEVPVYEHLFCDTLEKKLNIARILKSQLKKRKKLL